MFISEIIGGMLDLEPRLWRNPRREAFEMQKSKDEDLLSEQTLKTIEIVNIADIAIEKKNLET